MGLPFTLSWFSKDRFTRIKQRKVEGVMRGEEGRNQTSI